MVRHDRIELAPDFFKAVGIALVVFGHVLRGLFSAEIVPEAGIWPPIDRMIYLFHMPLFFYASGLFVEHSVGKYGYKGFVRKSAFALLLPLVVWSYLQYSIQFIAGAAVNSPISLFYVLTAPFPPRQQFWFLAALFLIGVVAALLFRFRHSHRIIWVLVALLFVGQALLWGTVQEMLLHSLYTSTLTQIFVHLPFFMLGIVLTTDKIRSVKIPSLVCAGVFAASLWGYEALDILNGMVHTIASVLCVLSLYKICVNVTEGKTGREPFMFAVLFVGMNSMIIYLAHVIGAAGYRVVLSKLGFDQIPLHLIGGTLVGIFAPLVLVPLGIKLAERHPRLASAVLPVRYERR